MWQSRRWRHLLNIIDQLPRHSAFGEALTNDEELAHEVAKRRKHDDSGRAPSRSMRDFTVEVELLSVVADRIAELIQAVAATKGAKAKQNPIRMPRPVTALQRVTAQRRRAKHDSVVARVLPGREAPAPVRRRRLGRPQRAPVRHERDYDTT